MAKSAKIKGIRPDMPLYKAMPKVASTRLKELVQWEDAIESGDSAGLHQMRIAAKRLRYALEAVAPAYGKRLKALATRVKGLQDVLGELHDNDVLQASIAQQIADLQQRSAERLIAERVAYPIAISGGSRQAPLGAPIDRPEPSELMSGLQEAVARLRDRRDELRRQAKQEWKAWHDDDLASQATTCLKTR